MHVIFEPVDFMAHIPVRQPAGDLRSCKPAVLPICHRQTGRPGAEAQSQSDALSRCITPGILPSALRASLRLFKIAPGDFVAPNSKQRALVTPAKRGKGDKPKDADGQEEQTPVQRHATMTWAQRLKRVFGTDVETCRVCGYAVSVMPKALATLAGQALACIEDPVVIKKILAYLQETSPTRAALLLPDSRAPSQSSLFG